MSYYAFKCSDGTEYGSFEVFYEDKVLVPGFYWQACSPGCIPDGEPNGPFKTAQEALEDAQSFD